MKACQWMYAGKIPWCPTAVLVPATFKKLPVQLKEKKGLLLLLLGCLGYFLIGKVFHIDPHIPSSSAGFGLPHVCRTPRTTWWQNQAYKLF